MSLAEQTHAYIFLCVLDVFLDLGPTRCCNDFRLRAAIIIPSTHWVRSSGVNLPCLARQRVFALRSEHVHKNVANKLTLEKMSLAGRTQPGGANARVDFF